MGQRRAIISSIQPGSIAEEIGLQPGHEILLVNGQAMEDVIDWSFAVADEEVVLTVRTEDGDEVVEIEKEYNERIKKDAKFRKDAESSSMTLSQEISYWVNIIGHTQFKK